jgi:hypothetical protein
MSKDDAEEGKGPGTVTVVGGEGRTAPPDAFTMADMREDLKAGLRRGSRRKRAASTRAAAAPDAPASPAPRDPLKAAYVIVGVSALLTAAGSALLLHLIGGPHLGPTTRWLAPLAGAGLFALLGVLLARSSVLRPQ